jgi:hypothetical protein
MTKIYHVEHYDTETLEDEEHDKLIGVYSTLELAMQAVAELRDKPGFRDCPEEFWAIAEMELDEIWEWKEGFV